MHNYLVLQWAQSEKGIQEDRSMMHVWISKAWIWCKFHNLTVICWHLLIKHRDGISKKALAGIWALIIKERNLSKYIEFLSLKKKKANSSSKNQQPKSHKIIQGKIFPSIQQQCWIRIGRLCGYLKFWWLSKCNPLDKWAFILCNWI